MFKKFFKWVVWSFAAFGVTTYYFTSSIIVSTAASIKNFTFIVPAIELITLALNFFVYPAFRSFTKLMINI